MGSSKDVAPPEVDLSEFQDDRPGGPGCWFTQLDFDDVRQAKIEAAVKEPKITHAKIGRVLKSWGFNVTAQSVGRHRRGDCGCVD